MHGDSPDWLAFEQAVAAQYDGSSEPTAVSAAKAAYFRAVARDVRAIAGRASDPDLRAALTGAADWADATANGQATTAAELTKRWQPVLDLCPKQSPGSSPTR